MADEKRLAAKCALSPDACKRRPRRLRSSASPGLPAAMSAGELRVQQAGDHATAEVEVDGTSEKDCLPATNQLQSITKNGKLMRPRSAPVGNVDSRVNGAADGACKIT